MKNSKIFQQHILDFICSNLFDLFHFSTLTRDKLLVLQILGRLETIRSHISSTDFQQHILANCSKQSFTIGGSNITLTKR